MKVNNLPYIPLDEEYSLNMAMLAIAISTLSHSKKGTLSLDINKLQVFMYLIKNPSKIDSALAASGKKPACVEPQLTYTIKSFSSNVDILFDNSKIKFLIKMMSLRGLLAAEKKSDESVKLYLSEKGKEFADSFTDGYFKEIKRLTKALLPLQTLPTSKLNSVINQVFKGKR
ncbi:ABC-three component system middle component 4 [Enterobacter asburiae]|uniref:ABC-three component system middle component 4 n=1 Tax=Enterobacter asburiae TaxID=61645 RepID=UPI0032AE8A18